MPEPIPLTAEAQFKAIVTASPIPTAVSNTNGTVLYANHTFAHAFGLTLAEVIGSRVIDYYSSREDLTAVLQALQQDGLTYDFEIKAKKRDGTLLWALVSVAKIDLDGELFYLIAFNDITERKAIEEALRQRTQLLEAVNQLGRDITATLNLEPVLETAVASVTHILDVTSAYISLWDKSWQTLTVVAEYYGTAASPGERVSDLGKTYDVEADLGVSPEKLREKPEVIITQLDDPTIAELERQHLESFEGKTVLEVPLQAKGKAIGYLDLWESRHKRDYSQDEINLVLAIAQQVALAIDNARLYEQAMEANRLKTEFLAKVSHELRTPLSIILGYLEMLQEGVYGQMAPDQQDVTSRIVANTGLLTRLVNDLLDAARLEAGKLTLKAEPFLLRDVIGRIHTQMSLLAQSKQLTFTINIADELPAIIIGDSDRIEQIVMNLVDNAIKYTEQGSVSLRIYRPEADYWALTVTDTGAGITAEARSHIFEAFRQVDDSLTRRHSGAGLGLAIVRQLARLMGGDIYLESEVGKGSVFTVLLPLVTSV